jgi:hypothetical protein
MVAELYSTHQRAATKKGFCDICMTHFESFTQVRRFFLLPPSSGFFPMPHYYAIIMVQHIESPEHAKQSSLKNAPHYAEIDALLEECSLTTE